MKKRSDYEIGAITFTILSSIAFIPSVRTKLMEATKTISLSISYNVWF